MEWWTGINNGPCSSLSSEQTTTSTASTTMTSCAASMSPAAMNQLDVSSTTLFDPWLANDELDLGTILNQAGAAAMAICESSSSTSVNQSANLSPSVSQNHSPFEATPPDPDQHNQVPDQQRPICSILPSDNKRHSISNPTTLQQRREQHEQQQHNHNHLHLLNPNHHQPVTGVSGDRRQANGASGPVGSTAGSPLSSSMGSSPLNQNAHYLSSPHSSSSPQSLQAQSSCINFGNSTHEHRALTSGPNSDDIKPFFTLQQHPHQMSSYFSPSDCCLIVDTVDDARALDEQTRQTPYTHNASTSKCSNHHLAGASRSSLTRQQPFLAYNDVAANIVVVPCAQQLQQQQQQNQNQSSKINTTNSLAGCQRLKVGNCNGGGSLSGSSLLTGLPAALSTNSRQAKQTTSKKAPTNTANAKSSRQTINSNGSEGAGSSSRLDSKNGSGQKLRRCRHITDYVLAEEEKRLLIKEGHADFPMTCQARPLTKTEERILRKIRRKIRNKKSAQCSRQRKKEYVEELERKYAAVLRENDELRQLLNGATSGCAGDSDRSLKFNQVNINEPQYSTATFDDHYDQQLVVVRHQNENFLISSQSSAGQNSMEQMGWKDLFPQSQTHSQSKQQQSSTGSTTIYT